MTRDVHTAAAASAGAAAGASASSAPAGSGADGGTLGRYRLALIGFGTVGQGLVEILRDRGGALRDRYGLEAVVTAVSDLRLGSASRAAGFEPEELLEAAASGSLGSLPADAHGWDALQTIERAECDVVAEMSFTNLETGEPGLGHVRAALGRGRHVITTNKGPVALRFPELLDLAEAHSASIGVEGTVMSGTPALALGTDAIAGAGVTRIEGILNGTTNYILTRMEAGLAYQDALAEAQEKGYAEADPAGDVEGHDAAGKVVILANLVMGEPLAMADVDCAGITGLRPDDVAAAADAGERWKLIGTVERDANGHVTARVAPERVPLDHPLAAVGGATNAITYTTDLLGPVTLVGPGAGRLETGYALIGDLLSIHRRMSRSPEG